MLTKRTKKDNDNICIENIFKCRLTFFHDIKKKSRNQNLKLPHQTEFLDLIWLSTFYKYVSQNENSDMQIREKHLISKNFILFCKIHNLTIWLAICAMCFNLLLSAIHYEYLMIFFFFLALVRITHSYLVRSLQRLSFPSV